MSFVILMVKAPIAKPFLSMRSSWVLFRKYTSFIFSILVRVILLCSWVIQEPLSFIKGPCFLYVFKLIGLSSILGSATSINVHFIFLSISVFLF